MTEIKISRNRLLGTLLRLRHVFYKKNSLPILDDYLFSIEDGCLVVTASDMEILMQETICLDKKAIKLEESGRRRWCVDRYWLIRGLKALDEQEITLSVSDYQLSVTHNSGHFAMPTDDASEYPSVDFMKMDTPYGVTFEAPGLRHWLELLIPNLAQDELRPVMNGFILDFKKDGLTMCASNGHRLMRIKKDSIKSDIENSIIMPGKVSRILRDILPRTGDVDLQYNPGDDKHKPYAMCAIDTDEGTRLEMYFRCIDGRYPNYNSVIPQNEYSVHVDRRQLIKCLERCSIFCNPSNEMVKINISNDRLALTSADYDFGINSDESMPCEGENKTGVPMTIGIKCPSMLSLLKRLSTQKIILSFSDSSRAMTIEPEPQPEVEEILVLMMPMLFND